MRHSTGNNFRNFLTKPGSRSPPLSFEFAVSMKAKGLRWSANCGRRSRRSFISFFVSNSSTVFHFSSSLFVFLVCFDNNICGRTVQLYQLIANVYVLLYRTITVPEDNGMIMKLS